MRTAPGAAAVGVVVAFGLLVDEGIRAEGTGTRFGADIWTRQTDRFEPLVWDLYRLDGFQLWVVVALAFGAAAMLVVRLAQRLELVGSAFDSAPRAAAWSLAGLALVMGVRHEFGPDYILNFGDALFALQVFGYFGVPLVVATYAVTTGLDHFGLRFNRSRRVATAFGVALAGPLVVAERLSETPRIGWICVLLLIGGLLLARTRWPAAGATGAALIAGHVVLAVPVVALSATWCGFEDCYYAPPYQSILGLALLWAGIGTRRVGASR